MFCSPPIANNHPYGRPQSSKMLLSTSPWVGNNFHNTIVRQSRESLKNQKLNRRVHRRFSSTTRIVDLSSFRLHRNHLTLGNLPLDIDHLGNNRATAKRSFSSTKASNEIIVNRGENSTGPVLSFSSVTETPLDSIVMEKPYTVVLMEDDISPSFYNGGKECLQDENNTAIELSPWAETFRSRIPRDYGMSFASISLQITLDSAAAGTVAILDALEALKDSSLPNMADAILVARGPVSSLCSQYYLESFPLKALIMIDPILFRENSNGDEAALYSFLSKQVYPNDTDSLDRFRSDRLLVEPNAVPMMVVRTVPEEPSMMEWCAAWRSCSQNVADRHGDHEGPYGTVPVVDLAKRSSMIDDSDDDKNTILLLEQINQWIEEDLQW